MKDLGITDVSAPAVGGCGCGGACGGHGSAHGEAHAHAHGESHTHGAAAAAEGQTFGVTGMTCDHCIRHVTEELTALDGVEGVAIDLKPGAVSSVVVTASRTLGDDEVREAVEEAGYSLAR
jgi:copper chaperone CopZ